MASILASCASQIGPGALVTSLPTAPRLLSHPTSTMPVAMHATVVGDRKFSDVCASLGVASPTVEANIAAIDNGLVPQYVSLKSGQKTSLGGEVYYRIAVSPDHEQAAYVDFNSQYVMVVDAKGKLSQSIPAQETWRQVLGWLNNNTLLIENFRTPKGGLFQPSSTISLNTSDGGMREYFPDYPDLLPLLLINSLHWQQYSTTLTVYSPPALAHVVYPALSGSDTTILLWDVVNRREVRRVHTQGYWGSVPQWNLAGTAFLTSAPPVFTATDGSRFKNALEDLPYVGGNELFRVDQNGAIRRLTYLTTQMKVDEESYAWSADEGKVAFWLHTEDDQSRWELAILDVATGKVQGLCIYTGSDDFPKPLFWSPDTRYLVVTTQDAKPRKLRIFLVDVERNSAMKIADDAIAMGWLSIGSP